MAYALSYRIQGAAKTEPTELIYTCEIYEDGYVGSVREMDPATSPFIMEVLASSDEVFDPIVSTSLTITVDTTDFTGDLPNFLTTNDRLYWVKLYADGTTYLVWQGFMIMQAVTIPFISGRTFLQMLCTDGLAMLKDIPYEPSDKDINVLEDLSTTITNCLNKIELPDGYNINYACNIFAFKFGGAMSESISPFKQAYYYPRNWLNSDQSYISCYDVLQNIALAWGCQIFQSEGEWWVANVNERGVDSLRFFRTTNANGVETVVNRWKQREIEPYSNPTDTPFYFQEASQVKILRKGYNQIKLKNDAAYATQMIDNGNMKVLSAGFPVNFSGNGIGSITGTSLGPYNAVNLQPTGGGPTQRTPTLTANSIAKAYAGDSLSLSFLIDGQATPSPTTPKTLLTVYLFTLSPFTEYWLDSDGNWVTTSTEISVIGTTSGTYQSISYSSSPFPINGTLSIFWKCDNFDTLTCTIANVLLRFNSPYNYYEVFNNTTADSYKKEVEVYMGAPSTEFNYAQKGSILDSDGTSFFGWYRINLSESFDTLTALITQQYYNILSRPQLNFNATFRGLFDDRNSLGPIIQQRRHIIGPIDSVTVYDPTTNTLSATGKYYVNGALNYDYINDKMNGIILETSNTDISTTFTQRAIASNNG